MKHLYRIVPLILIAAAPAIAFGQAKAEQMVLLTGEEGPLGSVATGEGLPAFLNNLYTLIIGAAVILAVLQIIRGGIMWMLTDSFVEKGQARHLVTIAVMGLVLVLSPVIVFNIINPCILSLSLRGSEECEGSLQGLDPEVKPAPKPEPVDPKAPVEKLGTYVDYGKMDLSLLDGFKAQHCGWIEDGVDTKIPTPIDRAAGNSTAEIVCGNYYKIRSFALCGDGTDILDMSCKITGVTDSGTVGTLEGFENECKAVPGAAFGARATAFGVSFMVDPDSFLNPHVFGDGCEDTEEAAIMSQFYPNGVPEGKTLHCYDIEPLCDFE